MEPILDSRVQARFLTELAPHSHSFQQLKYIDINFLYLRASWMIGWPPSCISFLYITFKSASFPVVSTTDAENESSFLFIQTFETNIQHVVLGTILRVLLVALSM